MNQVLVIGFSGYIWKHVVKESIAHGFQVIVNDLCHKNLGSALVEHLNETRETKSRFCEKRLTASVDSFEQAV